MKTKNSGGYVVISNVNPALILCTDGEFRTRSMCGPGGYCAKVYKTEAGAKCSHPGRIVQAYAE